MGLSPRVSATAGYYLELEVSSLVATGVQTTVGVGRSVEPLVRGGGLSGGAGANSRISFCVQRGWDLVVARSGEAGMGDAFSTSLSDGLNRDGSLSFTTGFSGFGGKGHSIGTMVSGGCGSL